MEWRVSFLVNQAKQTPEGWLVHGEPGLGPPTPGDQFTAVHHEPEGYEEHATFRVDALDGDEMWLSGSHDVRLRPGDILLGLADL